MEEHGTKRKGTHVNLTVQRDNVQELARCACGQLGWEPAMSCRATLRARAMARARSRGSLRNDGVVIQGMIVEDDCDDNYLAELAAILDQVEKVPAESQIVIMLDATLPVHAFIKFRSAHVRGGEQGTTARHGWTR